MIEARWEQTEGYYRTFWRDWLRSRSSFRRWVVPFGIALVLTSSVLLLVPGPATAGRRWTWGLTLGALGLFELGWHHWDRLRWFRAMNSAKHSGEVVMRFDRDRILMAGPTSHGEMTWQAVEEVVRGAAGLFLVLQRGLSVYVPFASLSAAGDIDAVERMFGGSRAASRDRRVEPTTSDLGRSADPSDGRP